MGECENSSICFFIQQHLQLFRFQPVECNRQDFTLSFCLLNLLTQKEMGGPEKVVYSIH